MSRQFALPPEWAAAIREDAASQSSPGVSRKRIGIEHKVFLCREVVVRVGTITPGFWHSRPFGRPNVCWLKKRPRCQDCGQLIEHNTSSVAYNFCRRSLGIGRQRFIHKECP